MGLRDKYIEPPFSILDTCSSSWRKRRAEWENLGIESEKGRVLLSSKIYGNATSIFDPVLCEIAYKWFCPDNGAILDPFCGGSVRGVVAGHLGYHYTGIDIRREQIEENEKQCETILGIPRTVQYITGDSEKVLPALSGLYDFVFSCPPYYDLEVYSDMPDDLSAMPTYGEFLNKYTAIIRKASQCLKKDGYACFVVSEIRSKSGFLRGFVPDTIKCFESVGLFYYNEIIIRQSTHRASMCAERYISNGKVPRIHQNMLVFKKF